MGGGGGAIHLPVCSGPRAPGPPSSPGRYNGPPPSGPARTRAQEGKSPDYGATASWQPMSRGQPHLCASTPHPRTSEAEVSLSLGHSGTRGVVLGHTLNTQTLKKSKTSHNGCRKCTIFCSEALIASQGSLRRRPPQPPLHLHPHPPPPPSRHPWDRHQSTSGQRRDDKVSLPAAATPPPPPVSRVGGWPWPP